MKRGRLPKTMWAPHGPVAVVVTTGELISEGERLDGLYKPDERTIYIAGRLRGFVRHETLEHEWLHAVITDAGGEALLSETIHEWVCEVVSKSLTSRRFARKRLSR